MNELITQVGVGGIFVVLVLQMVFSFLEKKDGKGSFAGKSPQDWGQLLKDVAHLRQRCDWIHAQHDIPDKNHPGAMVWWALDLPEIKKLLEQSIILAGQNEQSLKLLGEEFKKALKSFEYVVERAIDKMDSYEEAT